MTEIIKTNWDKFNRFLSAHMTKFLSLEVTTCGCVYLFTHSDPMGAGGIIALGLGLKGWQNFEKRKEKVIS